MESERVTCGDCGVTFPNGRLHMCEARTNRLEEILFGTRDPAPSYFGLHRPIPVDAPVNASAIPMPQLDAEGRIKCTADAACMCKSIVIDAYGYLWVARLPMELAEALGVAATDVDGAVARVRELQEEIDAHHAIFAEREAQVSPPQPESFKDHGEA